MSELKDPAFKLFGKTIPVPSHEETPATKSGDSPEEDHSQSPPIKPQNDQQKNGESEEEQVVYDIPEDISESATTSSGPTESPKTDPSDKETTATDAKTLKQEQELNERSNSQEKTIKKPDKILPCPRCNSLDTKFCYYNNYNVNQPRHFCKNCQRYWTAGGTMRNVPVGAGRRKNKHSAAHHYRQITVSEALAGARPDASDPILCRHPFKPNGTVLNFGPDAPLCESMASVLTLADTNIAKRNGFHITEEMKNPGENVEEHSSGSSNLTEEGNRINLSELVIGNYQGFTPPVPCFPGTPWPPYPWNAAQWSPPQPSLCASSFPVPFYPSAYWGCAIPGAWSIPWLGTGSGLPSPSGFPSNSGPNSPLGKHTRDENTLEHCNSEKGSTVKPNNSEKCLWIPKTLRIDDPDEAARSSIWATLGIKNDKAELISGGGMFKAFKSKMEEKNHMPDTAHVLNANPAALSRSRNFHENL